MSTTSSDDQAANKAVGANPRPSLALRFAAVGGALGLMLGFVEAALLATRPRFPGLLQPDVSSAIWVIAPLADAPLAALIGLLFGWMAALLGRKSTRGGRWCAAIGFGLAAAYLGWLLYWFRIGIGIIVPPPFATSSALIRLLFTPALYFVIVFAASLFLLRRLRRRADSRPSQSRSSKIPALAILDLVILVGLAAALIFIHARETVPLARSTDRPPAARDTNNIVLISLDTVRADHLSCYGYARPTTPNLDKLAGQGVFFENAVAPTSWTLPSLSTMLTGLLPHQHGANWGHALDAQPKTLAEILGERGYETAAFNANNTLGLAGWGLDAGFDVYVDAHNWLRHNLAATFVGQSIYQMLFQQAVSFNEFDHMNAAQMNEKIFAWLHHRTGRPFFLFINYNDAHRPYVPPAPYDRKFGHIPTDVLWNLSFALPGGRPRWSLTEQQTQELRDGYDNSLNYLDAQIAGLLAALRALPDANRTTIIVVGDHGEGFGEHGTYDHGWNLYDEVLHVPLMISGYGVPAGQRVSDLAPVQEIFPTVLELALGHPSEPVRRASLARMWEDQSKTSSELRPIVSELSYWTPEHQQVSALSVRQAQWHYILNSSGSVELYDLDHDAAEKDNLVNDTASRAAAEGLRSELESVLAHSVFPWIDVSYLDPLNQPGLAFHQRVALHPEAYQEIGWPLGSAQAVFERAASPRVARPSPSTEDLLRSLPYH